ncbi:MAG: ABC transporter permease [Candidatus Aminicenantes bacterium]|nr:ABC transporter permease [Candidatus Aminicenantes bacterium]
MRTTGVIKKSIKEQLRNFWILLLTVTMAPFFIYIYYLINETTKPRFDFLVLNQDQGATILGEKRNYGSDLIESIKKIEQAAAGIPITLAEIGNRAEALNRLKNKDADVLVIIPGDFSGSIHNLTVSKDGPGVAVELVGDLTDMKYLIGAVCADEAIKDYIFSVTQRTKPVRIIETALGMSGHIDDFDLYVPGLLILSLIMLMFSAAVAIVAEVENKTIIRLKLSKLTALEYLAGVGFVQVLVGIISVLLTLIVAIWLGFSFTGAWWILLLLAVLTGISIIAFSLILAAITKTVNEVLIVGNFPLFLFMFFTGAAFPMRGKELFSLAGYPVTVQGLMSPTHSIIALKKVLIMNMGIKDILPELSALILLTVIYFLVGVWAFSRRHMKVE